MGRKPRKPRQLKLFKPHDIRMAKVPTPKQATRMAEKTVELAIYAKHAVAVMLPRRGLSQNQISWNRSNFQGHINAIKKLHDSPITLKNVESVTREIRARVSNIEYRMQALSIPKQG